MSLTFFIWAPSGAQQSHAGIFTSAFLGIFASAVTLPSAFGVMQKDSGTRMPVEAMFLEETLFHRWAPVLHEPHAICVPSKTAIDD